MLLRPNDKLLFIGDSVTDVDRARPVGQGYGFGLGHGYPLLVMSRLALARPHEDYHIVNTGTSGDTSRGLVQRWSRDVLEQRPQVVSILIGINDVWRHFDDPAHEERQIHPEEYRANLLTLVEDTVPRVRAVILLTPFFMELHRDDPMRAMTDEYAQICREVAARFDRVFLVDTQKAFDELLAKRHYMTIASDRVHPNTIGHMLIADLVSETILRESVQPL